MISCARILCTLYASWPQTGRSSSTGRILKKNAGEVSLTILSQILSWNYELESLSVFSHDRDSFRYLTESGEYLTEMIAEGQFVPKNAVAVPVRLESNDSILCSLYRSGHIRREEILALRKNPRKIIFRCRSKEQIKVVDAEEFISLIEDECTEIIF